MDAASKTGFCPARQVGKFATYCPALGKMSAVQPSFKLRAPEAASKILELLRDHSVVVLCGSHEQDFAANRQIGKTRLVQTRLVPAVRERGKSRLYLNLQDLLDPEMQVFYGRVDYRDIQNRLSSLPEADVYFFDDVQYALPVEKEMHTPGYMDSFALIWNKIGALVKEGKKVVFISTHHPKDACCQRALYNEQVSLFFMAPRVELLR